MSSHEVRALRAASFRLSSAAPEELISVAPHVAASLIDCKTLLSAAPSTGKDAANSIAVQKLKSQITTLLTARTAHERWAGTVLVKTVIEAGGLETLSKSGVWVRPMLANLNKPDPPTSKRLAIIALTRIFDLTRGHQSIIREMTTPSLPAFITACLGLADPKVSSGLTLQQAQARHTLLETIILSFSKLLPTHPTIFRSYLTQLQNLIRPLIVNTIKSSTVSPATVAAAQNLFTLLHLSSPKNNKTSTAENYSQTFDKVLSASHTTVSLVFRSIVEDWRPIPGNEVPSISNTNLNLASGDSDELELGPWTGIHNGCERLRSLLSLIAAFASSQTSQEVSFPLGSIVDLLLRVGSVVVPLQQTNSKGFALNTSMRMNEQISQTERDALFTELPAVHAASMNVIVALCELFGPACMSLHDIFLEQIIWVFGRENFNADLRTSCYEATSLILESSGMGLKKDTVRQCAMLLERCCDDVLSSLSPLDFSIESKKELNADTLSNSFQDTSSAQPSSGPARLVIPTPLSKAASTLLSTALSRLPANFIPNSLRSNMDRTAILAQDTKAMMASILNQPTILSGGKPRSSILPFLAQAAPTAIETEGLLRPRVPAVVLPEPYVEQEDDSDKDDEMSFAMAEERVAEGGEAEESVASEPVHDPSEPLVAQKSDAISKKRPASPLSGVAQPRVSQFGNILENGAESASKKARLATFEAKDRQPEQTVQSKSIQITSTVRTRPDEGTSAPKTSIVTAKTPAIAQPVEDNDDEDDMPELILEDSDENGEEEDDEDDDGDGED